jgi:hypothetical protein
MVRNAASLGGFGRRKGSFYSLFGGDNTPPFRAGALGEDPLEIRPEHRVDAIGKEFAWYFDSDRTRVDQTPSRPGAKPQLHPIFAQSLP